LTSNGPGRYSTIKLRALAAIQVAFFHLVSEQMTLSPSESTLIINQVYRCGSGNGVKVLGYTRLGPCARPIWLEDDPLALEATGQETKANS
jgi:hypothetical protein